MRLACFLSLAALAPAQDTTDLIAQLDGTRTGSAAYSRLRRMKTPDVLAGLRQALPGFGYRGQSLGFSLVQSFPRPQAEPVARAFLRGKPSFLRLAAASYLYRDGEDDLVAHIVACLKAPADDEALAGMLNRTSHLDAAPIREAVIDLLQKDRPLAVLDPALRMLARGGAHRAVPLVEGLLAGSLDAERRVLCAAFLLAMGESSGAAPFIENLAKVQQFSRVGNLLREAGRLDDAVLEAVLAYAEGKRDHNARYALELLARHDYRKGAARIRKLLESKDAETCKAAFAALMGMGEGLDAKTLRGLVTGEHPVMLRIAAADALRRLDDLSALKHLVGMIDKELRDRPRERDDAVEALGKFRSRDAVPALLDALADTDHGVRARALRGLETTLRTLFPYRRFDLQATGYTPSASAAQRQAGLQAIRRWWDAQKRER